MTDKVTLTIDLTLDERQKIEELAQQRGYEAPADYIKALVEFDSEDGGDFDEDPKETFRRAWHEAMTGQTHPVSTLWDALR